MTENEEQYLCLHKQCHRYLRMHLKNLNNQREMLECEISALEMILDQSRYVIDQVCEDGV